MADSKTYRDGRKGHRTSKFLSGEARNAYILRPELAAALKERGIDAVDATVEDNYFNCTCQERLGQFSDRFKEMLHFKSKSKLSETREKKPARDLTSQNQWLIENVFDSYGNYVYCYSCIKSILHVGGTRLRRLRKIKQRQSNCPTVKILKSKVPNSQIRDVIFPTNIQDAVEWWENLDDDSVVELRIQPKLHEGHGNNRKKGKVFEQFLDFVDNNSQSNGRRIGSHGPLYYFNSKFTRVNAPSASETNKPEAWKSCSLVYEFNRTIESGDAISNGTAKKWLKEHRPRHAICPRKTDYCEMCAECRQQESRHSTIAMRLRQEGDGDEDEIRENEALAESYKILLNEHRLDASNELQHYKAITKDCRSKYLQIPKRPEDELANAPKESALNKLCDQVVFTLSIDYQQSKLVPHWGRTAQPSETYYMRKLSHNVFGIVDHTLERDAIYITDERIGGAKNANMTISHIHQYIQRTIPAWANHLCLFMDNGRTNKNQSLIHWAMELVCQSVFRSIRICFFVPGHGKNDVDRLFSRVSHAFNKEDVFDTKELKELVHSTISPMGNCFLSTNKEIISWRDLLELKYAPFPGINSYRDFLIVRKESGDVTVNFKECCYTGEYKQINLVKDGKRGENLIVESSKHTYWAKDMSFDINEKKLADLVRMYDKFIDPRHRPDWLPNSVASDCVPDFAKSNKPSADLAREHRILRKKRRRKTG